MTGSITSAFCTQAKADLMSGLYCINSTVTFTATGTSTASWTSVSALTGLAVGMVLTGTNVGANCVIARITGATTMTVSPASTGALGTITATGDLMNIGLFGASVTGTYGAATTNYSQVTGNSDEVSGTGYTAGGVLMTNVGPATSGTTAYVSFSPNPSWTSATFTSSGAFIYNTTQRGPLQNQTIGIYSFGGTQSVSSGTFTAIMPSATASTAVLRIQ